jgi:ATP-dependent Lhr-like helicase
VLAGDDVLLLAPTAGGKTEAAVFPLLTVMAEHHWPGLSVLYVTPLRALLNNLEPRLSAYMGWLGRRVGLWHGDVRPGARRRLAEDPPEILLTTPESLEGMLVSTKVDHRRLFGDVRVVVVDELHAFAGDDRGWHLLAVLSRVARLAERDLQRVGLSATVGNPQELLGWLQGGRPRSGRVVGAGWASTVPAEVEIEVDAVGSARNAARVITALHRGEKRLVFCDSRRQAEEVASSLRAYEVETFVSHSSLSADERRRAEDAFAVGRDCVVVATSTLELGLDVGDLDRVIQVDAPYTVAGFLQRLGRTGRRPGTTRNCLFLATRQDALLRALGLLLLWSRGFVEPIRPPPDPAHVVAHQVLALALQESAVPGPNIASWWEGMPGFGDAACARDAVEHLLAAGYLDVDGGLLFIGPEAEQRYGHRHFRDLTSVLAADPEFVVLHGRAEVGTVHPLSLVTSVQGPRLLLLAGRSWRVEHIDWHRRRCHVLPVETGGRVRWQGEPRPLQHAGSGNAGGCAQRRRLCWRGSCFAPRRGRPDRLAGGVPPDSRG